ncbi:HU family DNA-binding protein [Alistipes ihumii]|uniref:HU family DNA-binding protein n=1 Tax=Alistipes ihumii TaxID=1470347 RepID=UPI003AF11A3F
MNKTQLVDAIAKKASITKVDAKKALDAFINVIGETLKAGDKIALIGFGSFAVAKKPGRTGRNPRTGASIKIAAKNVVKFKAGAELNALVK